MVEGRHFSTSVRPDSPLSRKLAAHGLRAVAVALMLTGATVLAWPYVEAAFNRAAQRVKIGQFEEDVAALREDVDRLADLARAVDEYNAGLDANGQSGLCDAWSYTEPSFDLGTWGLKDGVYGRLRIPGASIDMPVYLGATEQHLLDGAAHLTQTSLPMRHRDGISTAAVLAGHRGYRANSYFNNIVNLAEGAEVRFDSPWETLEYRVAETRVIDPADIDSVKIQPGRDLLILVTCHPLYKNYQRFVVYCEMKR